VDAWPAAGQSFPLAGSCVRRSVFVEVAVNPDAVADLFSSCRWAIAGHHQNLRSRVTMFHAEVAPSLTRHRTAQREIDRIAASAFTIFEWIRPDENRLSDIFAELLDAEGTHGQGPLFLGELLRIAGVPLIEGLDQARAWREDETWLIDNPLRRIDISVVFPRLQFGIGIENKPWASDQPDQVADYVKHLRLRYGERFLFLYWSGQGKMPSSLKREERESLECRNQLRVWSYRRELRRWLETSRQACRAAKVRWFLDDLLGFLAANFVDKPDHAKEEA
jgi:hypothetical protein